MEGYTRNVDLDSDLSLEYRRYNSFSGGVAAIKRGHKVNKLIERRR